MMKWNCVVTCPRHMEQDATGEMLRLLDGRECVEPEVRATGISGVLVAHAGGDPVEFSRSVASIIPQEPWSVRYVRRIIPVHVTGQGDVQSILDMAASVSGRIGSGQTYRVSVEKRNTQVSGRDIIHGIADMVPNAVSLENPQCTILVEILGGIAGVGVVRPGDVFSLDLAKRGMTDV